MKFFDWRLWISEDFLKTLKVKKLVWLWRLGIHSRNMKCEDFCFRSFIFSFLSHRKHRTVKGGRGNTKEKFPSDAQLKIQHLPFPSSEAIGNLIQFSHILQWQRRSSSGLWGIVLTEELGKFASADCLHSEEHDSPEEFESQNSDRCCAMRQLSQNMYPPNGHIIEEHLCLIMSGCFLRYK